MNFIDVLGYNSDVVVKDIIQNNVFCGISGIDFSLAPFVLGEDNTIDIIKLKNICEYCKSNYTDDFGFLRHKSREMSTFIFNLEIPSHLANKNSKNNIVFFDESNGDKFIKVFIHTPFDIISSDQRRIFADLDTKQMHRMTWSKLVPDIRFKRYNHVVKYAKANNYIFIDWQSDTKQLVQAVLKEIFDIGVYPLAQKEVALTAGDFVEIKNKNKVIVSGNNYKIHKKTLITFDQIYYFSLINPDKHNIEIIPKATTQIIPFTLDGIVDPIFLSLEDVHRVGIPHIVKNEFPIIYVRNKRKPMSNKTKNLSLLKEKFDILKKSSVNTSPFGVHEKNERFFRLWKDCEFNCAHCFNQNIKPNLTAMEKQKILNAVTTDVSINEYEAIRLQGGEISPYQLLGVESVWFDMIDVISNSNIKTVSFVTSLMYGDLSILINTVKRLISANKKVVISTSDDIFFRFGDVLEQRKLVESNIYYLQDLFPGLSITCFVTLTQLVVDQLVNNTYKFLPVDKIFYNLPSVIEPKNYDESQFEQIKTKMLTTHKNFFPKRESVIRLFLMWCEKNEHQTLLELMYTCTIWNSVVYSSKTNSFVYADWLKRQNKCGHSITYSIYSDSDRCVLCDGYNLCQ
jgi:hypothetical protein